MARLYIIYGASLHHIWRVSTSYMARLYIIYGASLHHIWRVSTSYIERFNLKILAVGDRTLHAF
ncbi:MAG: hypothetical protein RIM23_23255, partial [Coleofasciculus sp. G3-WIS-01]|uniref:hypothetical protein n=1 Tax=Coleofasciculus sp. G3-WIS-01 TaxID=3069528 RepID=UPI0032F90952